MGPLTVAKGKQYIGIDLGTTFSAMAYLSAEGQPITILNAENDRTTASVVLFEPGGGVVVGQTARTAALTQPDRVADCVKRDIGQPFYSRPINGRQLAPEAISALVLKKLKQDAELRIGPVHGAVITVPAYFDERRRQATVAAGQIAGLEVLDILNEPTAASLAYALRDFILKGGDAAQELRLVGESVPGHNALIYDLGGGTFDVTLLKIDGNDITVLATDGDVRLGGRDWDDRIVDHAAMLFIQKYGSDPRKDPRHDPVSHQRLLLAAEELKKELSLRPVGRLEVRHGGQSLAVEMTRNQLEQMTADLLYRTENRLARVLRAAGLSWDKIDRVLTVGGSTRMPAVLTMLQRVTGRQPDSSLSPDEVVAHGAAVHAAITLIQKGRPPRRAKTVSFSPPPSESSQDMPLLDDWTSADGRGKSAVAAPGLGGPGSDEMPVLIEDNEPIAARDGEPAAGDTRLDMDVDHMGEDPNEMTQVLGAIVTTNVNAHSLGVALRRDDGIEVSSIIIPRNTPLPASVTRRYGTGVPNQTAITVKVVEGEASLAADCIQIGSCRIHQLPWGLRKGSTVYVTFSYDNSGRLTVKAVEATSGKSAATSIYREGAMNPEQITRVKEAVTKIVVG